MITCYNDHGVLEKCIKSISNVRALIENQIDLSLFVVAIDDCSTDSSSTLLAMALHEKKIDAFFTNKTNKGVSFSRNRGIVACSGTDYVTFVDSDDTINDELIKVFTKDVSADLVVCNFSVVNSSSGKRFENCFFESDKELSSEDLVTYLLKYYQQPNKRSLFTTCWGKFYKTKTLLAEKKIFFKERLHLCEDTEFVHRFLCNQQGGVQFINNCFYDHSVSSGKQNRNKATFGAHLDLSHQLSFISAVRASKPFMIKNGVEPSSLQKQILHCFGAYMIIYSIRSCIKIRSVEDFFLVSAFWKRMYCKPLLKKAITVYSPKKANGGLLLVALIRTKMYLLATAFSYFICRRRYFQSS